jgi:hypothetical protein
MNGTVKFALNPLNVQMEELGMFNSSNVFALKEITGVDLPVYQYKDVQADNTSIQ